MVDFHPRSQPSYRWTTINLISQQNADRVYFACFGVPEEMQDSLRAALSAGHRVLRPDDPSSLLVAFLHEVVLSYDVSVWQLRDHVRDIEKVGFEDVGSSLCYILYLE
jgi:hypothetical protein